MSSIKTYGAKGLMEWQCLIRSGKSKLHITFTGGTLTEYGVSSAKYTTSNPIIQDMIERSDYFKNGKITLLRTVESKVRDKETVKTQEKTSKSGTKDKGLKTVPVASLDDAKEYLTEHFGLSAQDLLTKKAIEAAAKANGIVFEL